MESPPPAKPAARALIGEVVAGTYVRLADERPGIEMPGICGETWHYHDAFVLTARGAVIQLRYSDFELRTGPEHSEFGPGCGVPVASPFRDRV